MKKLLNNRLKYFLPAFLILIVLSLGCTNSNENNNETNLEASENSYEFELGFPTDVTTQSVYDATDLRRATEAYKFFFGTMQSEVVMQQMLSNGAVINEVGHVMATSPLRQHRHQ